MQIFPFVSSVLSAGCVFSCSVGKAAQNANKGRFFTFFLPPFSNHSARHRLPLLGYQLAKMVKLAAPPVIIRGNFHLLTPLSVGSEQDDPVRCQGPMLALVC